MSTSLEAAGLAGGPDLENPMVPEAAEQAPGFLDNGRARREAFNKKVESAKASLSSWVARGKTWFGGGAEKASAAAWGTIDAGIKTPGAVAGAVVEGAKAVDNAVDKTADAIIFGGEVAGRAAQLGGYYAAEGVKAVDKKTDEWAEAIDDKITDARLWTNKKAEAVATWTKDKAELTAVLGAHVAEGVAGVAKDKVAEAKEKVKGGFSSMFNFYKNTIASAENKIAELKAAKLARENAAKLVAARELREQGRLMQENADLEIARLEGVVALENNLMQIAA